MDWRDTGIFLSSRPHGETAAIIDVLTQDRGRHAGVLHGGQSRKKAAMLQPGNLVSVAWRGRLEEQIGVYTVELERDRAASLMSDRLALAGLGAVSSVLAYALPERVPVPDLYARTSELLDVMLLTPAWPLLYLRWECALLDALGFGLSLDRCAVTGATEGLVYVSPKTARAVSSRGAGDWADRLLPLPPCLRGEEPSENIDIAGALGTTGFFLQRHATPQWTGQPFPAARGRLIDLLSRTGPRDQGAGTM